MTRDIHVDSLVAHPENCNFMDVETAEKVKRHITSSGNYEPLTVRPCPDDPDKYQVINGHHRLKVLKELGYEKANCTVWEVDDDQTRLYLATLNRLSGKDVPERRAMLLEKLLGTYEAPDLSELLPDSKKQIEEISRMAKLELEKLKPFENLPPIKFEIPVMLSFLMNDKGASIVNKAIEKAISKEGDIKRSEALVKLAESYINDNR